MPHPHCLPAVARRMATAGLLLLSTSSIAQTELRLWHSMQGALGEWVEELAQDFNARQTQARLVPSYKGAYDESMSTAIAAMRQGTAPHLLQVYEVGTAALAASRSIFVPVEELLRVHGSPLDVRAFVPAVASYYTDARGQMLSMPFNSSTTVFHYNKDAFKAAGLDPNKPPSTWPEVALAAAKLKASGHRCPFTTSWISWTQFESFSAWHNVEFATKNNGFGGLDTRLAFNTPLHVRHIENLANMARQGLFIYKGRDNVAHASFYLGECAMMTGSSAMYANVKKHAKFAAGIAPLPYYPDVPGAPQNTVIGGASLWVLAGKKPAEYAAVAKFLNYLMDPEVAARSHQRSGYLPLTQAAFKLTDKSGFYRQNPGPDVAVTQMIRRTTAKSRGVRLGNFIQIRSAIDDEMEQVWAGKKSAKDGIDAAIVRGNELLERFEKANR